MYHNGNSADSTYRSVVGTNFSTSGVILGNTNHNVQTALGRLTSHRFTELPKLLDLNKVLREATDEYVCQEDRIRACYSVYLANPTDAVFHAEVKPFVKYAEDFLLYLQETNVKDPWKTDTIKNLMHHTFLHYITSLIWAIDHVDDPHPKRDLRMDTLVDLFKGSDPKAMPLAARLWLRKVLYKMKKDEIAKPGKWARMIGDMGVAASLQGFGVTDLLKAYQCRPDNEVRYHEVENFRIYVCKSPDFELMLEVFRELIHPSSQGTFVIFSDDSCASIRFGDEVTFGNLDISGCDSSHGPHIFAQLVATAPLHLQADLQVLVEQCQLPFEVRNVDCPKQKVVFRDKNGHPSLYSGSTLTTCINNFANILIALQCIKDFQAGLITRFSQLAVSAAKVGYVVTIQECNEPEELQFLKHSPLLNSEGERIPVLNLGVLLRSAGVCKGDVPGPKSIHPVIRGAMFTNALLDGMCTTTTCDIDQAMRQQVQGYLPDETMRAFARKHLPYFESVAPPKTAIKPHVIPLESHAKRYGIDPIQFQILVDYIQCSEHLAKIGCPAVDRVLEMDYGL